MRYFRILHTGVLGHRRADGVVPEDRFPKDTDFDRLAKIGAVAEASEDDFKAQEGEAEEDREKAADAARAAQPSKDAPLPKHAPKDAPVGRDDRK